MPTPNTAEPSGQNDGSSNPLYDALFSSADAAPTKPEETRPGRSIQDVLAEADAAKDNPPPADADKGTPPADKPTDKPVTDKQPAADPAQKPAEQKVKVTRRKATPAPLPEPELPPEPKPERRAKPEPEPEPDVEFSEEERDMLETARVAEGVDPKFKGYAGKLDKFYRAHADFMKKKRGEDPEFDFSEDNPEYSAWLVANRPPAIPQHELRKIERERIRQEISSDADAKVAQVREELRRRDEEPKIRDRSQRFMTDSFKESLPDEVAALLKEKGVAAARAEYPYEFHIVSEVAKQASGMMSEFLSLTSGIKKFNADQHTDEGKMHKSIIDWIDQECDDFATNGGPYRIREGGQTFLGRTKFYSLPAAQRTKYWTFSDDDLIEIAKGTMKRAVTQQLAASRSQLESMGFVRKKAAPAAEPAAKPAPTPTPSQPRGSQAPGAAPTEPAVATNAVMGMLGLS